MLKVMRFKWLIAGFLAVVLLVTCIAYEEHRAADKYKHHRAEYCAASFTTPQQKESCIEEKADAQDYVPWEIAVFSWPVGITAWAVIGTLFVIGWQSNETRRAAAATEKYVSIARRQIEMTKDKERARVELMPERLILDTQHAPYWSVNSFLKIRNLGMSRAHITRFKAEMVWFEDGSEEPKPDISDKGNIFSDSYIDPSEDWGTETPPRIFISKTDSINLDWFASGIYDGSITVLVRAVIEYATVGTTYIRICRFEWKASGRPGGYSQWLIASTPDTNEAKTEAGYWKSERDDEYEIENPENPN